MDNFVIYIIWLVILEYFDIFFIFKWFVIFGDDGVFLVEMLWEDKVYDGFVLLFDIIIKFVVVVEVWGDVLEEVGVVWLDFGEDCGLGFDFVVGVGGRDYGEVFWVEVEEVGGVGLSVEMGGDVYVLVGDVFFIFVGLFFWGVGVIGGRDGSIVVGGVGGGCYWGIIRCVVYDLWGWGECFICKRW